MLLFYDTETTGLPDRHLPEDHPHQPHLLQFAARLVDPETRRCVGEVHLIVRPDGWTVPRKVEELTGITAADASRFGVSEATIARLIAGLMPVLSLRVAHNDAFDFAIVRTALLRHNATQTEALWRALPAYCTKERASPICNLPPTERMIAAGFTKPKDPRLEEAHQILLGVGFDGAHNALADVQACERVYWHLIDRETATAA